MKIDTLSIHHGIKYILTPPDKYGRIGMYTWNKLVRQFIFEQSVKSDEDARRSIEQLIADNFLNV